MTRLFVAHVGHWIGYALYAIPILVVAIGIVISHHRSRDVAEPDDGDEQAARRELDRILSE